MENLWTREEFLCFLLIYSSNADFEISKGEKHRLASLFDEATFMKQLTLFNDVSDYKALEMILNHKSMYFSTDEEKLNLIQMVKEQALEDGEVSKFELEQMKFLERIL
jgi:hypothetical protein